MNTQFDISKLIASGQIRNELDFERALVADRKLRVLAKEDPEFKTVRKKLRDLIAEYENQNWSTKSDISDKQFRESDIAESVAEKERLFIQRRKVLIKEKLKQYQLKQQEFGEILGHSSKSYISELMNGVSPFSLKDLVVINRLLKIDLQDLVPTFLSNKDRIQIRSTIKRLDNPKLKLSKEDLALV